MASRDYAPDFDDRPLLNMRRAPQQRDLGRGSRSRDGTPPLDARRRDGPRALATQQCTETALVPVRLPPPPPPPPRPLAWVEVENLVLDALRRKDPNLPSGWPGIIAAAFCDEVDSVQWLLEVRADPNPLTSNRATPLWNAVTNANASMVQLLLDARADANHKKKTGKGTWRSVLDMAISDGVPESICQILQLAGAQPGHGRPPMDFPGECPQDGSLVAFSHPHASAASASRHRLDRVSVVKDDVSVVKDELSEEPHFGVVAVGGGETDTGGLLDEAYCMGAQSMNGVLSFETNDREAPAMHSGSAFAARSAFRKSYSKQLLPICDDKPVLDFSAYRRPGQPKVAEVSKPMRSYAGLPLRGVRGMDQDVERARARIAHEASAPDGAVVSAAGAVPGPGALLGEDQPTSVQAKVQPDLLQDPWGCIMAVAKPELLATALAGVVAAGVSHSSFSGTGLHAQPDREHAEADDGAQPQISSVAACKNGVGQALLGPIANGGDAAAGGIALPSIPHPPPPLDNGRQRPEYRQHAEYGGAPPAQIAQQPPPPPPHEGQHAEAARTARAHPSAIPSFSKASASVPPGVARPPSEPPPVAVDRGPPAHMAGAELAPGGPVEENELPRMADLDHLPTISNNEMPTAVQWQLVQELAGGARFHDPARDRFASRDQVENTCLIDVRILRFCHETISPHFMHGTHHHLPVLSLLEELHKGKADSQRLPPLVVMRSGRGLDVVCGNRRLYCLKRYAAESSKVVSAWCIVYDLMAQDTPRALVMKYILATTSKDGGSIKLRSRR